MIFALLGCGFGLDPLATAPDAADVTIASVDPSWGPPEGGTELTITGTGFTGDVSVELGQASVAVTVLDEGTLVVTTPFAGVEATVDVVVRSDLGVATAAGAFTFAYDEPEDTGGDDSGDDSGGGDDGVGAVVEYSYFVYACPECFTGAEQLYVNANAAFHDGVDGSWTSWLPALGDCVDGTPTPTQPASRFVDMGDWVYLNSRTKSVSMQGTDGSSGVTYLADGLGQDDYDFAADFDLSVPEGGAWGAFDVADAVETPAGFDAVSPAELLETNPNRAFSARFSRSGQTVTWSPSGGDGSFLVLVDVYNAQGTAYLGSVACRDADDGSMLIPSSALGYPSGSLLAVTLYRYQLNTFALPTGAAGESVATVGVIGTGILQ